MNTDVPPFQSQARLWLTAFLASALLNAVAWVLLGLWVLGRIVITPPIQESAPLESVAWIVPQAVEAEPAVPAEPERPAFARTSPDQEAAQPETPRFIGERNTRATSDAAPVPDAPEMPSQKGREPVFEGEIETTESRYQDGELSSDRIGQPAAAVPQPASPPPPAPEDPAAKPADLPAAETMPAKDRLAEGPVPVDRMVREAPREKEEAPKPPTTARAPESKQADPSKNPTAEAPKPAANPEAPGFRGNQTKTRLEGSITRSGRSALDVEDSLLGRYHAAVSRAVEKEWQRNCVRNRDYITPGLLTMSFLLDASGKVRSVRVVEDVQVGAIPKGFTLNSIHDAEIPAMPGELKKQLGGEPLELIYRFNF
jgi:hypothetical protein